MDKDFETTAPDPEAGARDAAQREWERSEWFQRWLELSRGTAAPAAH